MEKNTLTDKKLKQREAEIAVINSVQTGLLSGMEMQEIYDLVGEHIRNLFDAQVAVVSTFNYGDDTEHFHYAFEDGERHDLSPRPIDKLRKRLIDSGEIICINENADEEWKKITGEEPTVAPGTKLTKSALYVPMAAGDTVFGYISLQNVDREHAFSESDIRLLGTLAGSISVALENARLFSETEQRNAELAVINSVQAGLVAEMDLQGIYDLVGEKIRILFDSQVTLIASFDHDSRKEVLHYVLEDGERFYHAARPYDGMRETLISTQKMIHINENAAEAIKAYGADGKPAPGTKFPKSMVYVPLILGDSVRGYVSLQNLDREFAFSDSDVRLLSTLANSMSVALENARLFNETEQRNAELAVINSVQEGLVAEMKMQGIYDLVGDKIRDLFDAQVAAIATFDHENGTERFQYIYENGKRYYPEPRPFDKIRQRLIKTQKLIWINENATEAYTTIAGEPPVNVPGTSLPKSMVYVPLVIGESVRGYVTLQNIDRELAFNESDVRLLSTLANSMSVALENARLFSETEQRNAELGVINSVQQGLVAEMDMQGIYDLVGDRIREVFDAQVAAIVTFDMQNKTEHFVYLFEDGDRLYPNPRPYDKVREKIIKERKTLLFNEKAAMQMSEINGQRFKPVPGTRLAISALYVPMVVGESVRGYVTLQNLDREQAFNDSDVRLLNTLVNSMSVALENARLFNETTRLLAETEQRATELHTVNHISRAMVSQLEFDTLIKLVGDQMKETFKADIVYIALYDRHTDTIFFPYEYGDKNEPRKFGDGFTERIITSNEPLLINKDIAEIREQLKARQIGRVTSSFLGVPIQTGDVPNGVISVQSTEEENRFDENDLRLLSTIAANVSVSMQNAEAYQKLRSALTDLKAAQEQLVQQEKLASLGQLTAGIAHEIKNPLNFVNNFSDLSLEMLQEVRDEISVVFSGGSLPAGGERDDLRIDEKGSAKTENKTKEIPDGSDTGSSSGRTQAGGESDYLRISHAVLAESHELITGILDDIQANLKKIHEHGTRADGIVKSMLLHSRGGSGKITPTDINELIKEYVNLAFHGMRAGKNPINVTIRLDLDENIKDVPLIAEDFSRVVLNLCNNAFDAMRDKEQANRSAVPPVQYNPELTVRTRPAQGKIFLEVEDNGPGIPDDIRDKILQPFFTTKKGKDGTGLGLSITNDIVKAHGGEIVINGIPGEGTKFVITMKSDIPGS
jgi:signal transduction histidine kinase